MAKRGHVCLFGVKYHAELAHAHIERFWMWIKQKIRPFLTGKLVNLKAQIWLAYKSYTVLDARRAARHCRETMNAYRSLASKSDLGLGDLAEEEKKAYATHRRVFDTNTAILKLAADVDVSPHDLRKAATAEKKRKRHAMRETASIKHKKDIAAYFRRVDKYEAKKATQ